MTVKVLKEVIANIPDGMELVLPNTTVKELKEANANIADDIEAILPDGMELVLQKWNLFYKIWAQN